MSRLDEHERSQGANSTLPFSAFFPLLAGITVGLSQTRLVVRFQYRLSTRFNWYAGPVLAHLLENTADTYLDLYRDRASRAVAMRLVNHAL
jgi:hypothetical protein